jgi:hypothetical protein
LNSSDKRRVEALKSAEERVRVERWDELYEMEKRGAFEHRSVSNLLLSKFEAD